MSRQTQHIFMYINDPLKAVAKNEYKKSDE